MIADPNIIRDINIKDFNVFVDRDDLITNDPMQDRNLFSMKGNDWKNMRSIVIGLYCKSNAKCRLISRLGSLSMFT